MLVQNMKLVIVLVNRVRLIVREMHGKTVKLKIITENNKGQIVFLPRVKLTTDSNMPFSFNIIQFSIY